MQWRWQLGSGFSACGRTLAPGSHLKQAVEARRTHDKQLINPGRLLFVILSRKTISESISKNALEYIGALTGGDGAEEVIDFHSRVLCSQLDALTEVDSYHRTYPWKVVGMMDPASASMILGDMQKTWEFCLSYLDALSPGDKLYDMFSFTRWQAFRDVMIKAEHPVSNVKHPFVFAF